MKLHITCKQAVDFVSKKEEGKLSAWQRVQLWRHLVICPLCRLFAEQNKLITTAFTGKQMNEQLPEEKKQEIIGSVIKNKP